MGKLFIISGPSAVGKTSVANELLNRNNNLKRVLTCTTRAPRGSEKNLVDYIFMSKEDFENHIKNDDFAEYSEVYENYYGVLKSTIQDILDAGDNALLVVNWEGFLKIKSKMPAVGFFILPPAPEVLEQRIRFRGVDSEQVIERRLKANAEDMEHASDFDFQVVNYVIEDAAAEIESHMR